MMTRRKIGLALLLAIGWTAGAGALAQQPRTQQQPESRPATPSPTARPPRVDRYGDPLPPGARARLGSIHLRHNNMVNAVAFTPDGKTLLSGEYGSWAFLWDVATGKRLRAFRHNAIWSLAIDPHGKTAALGSHSDGNVKLYELATSKELRTIPGHLKGIAIVAFSPDGKLLATGGGDQTIRLWNAATARGIDTWKSDRANLPSLRFTPDGKRLAYLDGDGALYFRDVATGVERKAPGPLADARFSAFCFADQGKRLITGSVTDAGLLQLWDSANGEAIRTIARTQGNTGYIFLAPDGKSFWTADYDPRLVQFNVFRWDLATGKQLMHLSALSERLRSFALSPDGKRLAAGDRDGNIFLWDTNTGKKTLSFVSHQAMATAAVFAPDGRQVWTGSQDSTLRLWSAASSEQLRQFSTARQNDLTYGLTLRPDGKLLAMAVLRRTNNSATEKCDVRLWDLTTNTEREPLRGHNGWVVAVAFSPDGKTIASRSEDLTIRLWDAATGKQRQTLRCGQSRGKGVCFTPDGSRLIAALDAKTIGFWDVNSGRLVRRLFAGVLGGDRIPRLSSNGRSMLVGGLDQPLQLLEVATGKVRYRFENTSTGGYAVAALSPDNRILAVSGPGGESIQLWNLMTGELFAKLDVGAIPSYPDRLTFSPDSRSLASALFDGTTVIWEVPSPQRGRPARKPCEELWNELAGDNAAKAYRAVWALAAAPEQSLPFIRQRLAEAAKVPVERARIAHLLADLDSAEFAIREKASQGLQELGILAEPAMRKVRSEKPSLEVRRRLEQILDKLEAGARPSSELRRLRAFEVLQLVASDESRHVLRELTQGSPDSWLTHEAKTALAHWEAPSAGRP